nr:probable polygalacturonase isoform X3 [Ipomoea batatas]
MDLSPMQDYSHWEVVDPLPSYGRSIEISRSIYSFIVLSSPSMETSSLAASTRVLRSPTSQDLRQGAADPPTASSLEVETDLQQHRRSGVKEEEDDDESSAALL